MSPQELLRKFEVIVALWRTRRYDQLAAGGVLGGAIAFVWVLTGKTPIPLAPPVRLFALIALACFTTGCAISLMISIVCIQDPDASTAAIQALPSSVRGTRTAPQIALLTHSAGVTSRPPFFVSRPTGDLRHSILEGYNLR